MAEFNKEELLKIANLSAIKLNNEELAAFSQQIQSILDYVDQLKEVLTTDQHVGQYVGNTNILREDEAIQSNPQPILECAPQRDGNYFVVPKIFEEK